MSVDVTITSGYRDPSFFDDLNQSSRYTYIQSTSSPSVTVTPSHNQLNGLQGGVALQYYHVTLDEWHYLTNLVDQMTLDSALTRITSIETDDLILYGDIYFDNAGESSGGHEQKVIYWGETGDLDTYIYEYADDELRIACDSTLIMTFKRVMY